LENFTSTLNAACKYTTQARVMERARRTSHSYINSHEFTGAVKDNYYENPSQRNAVASA